MRPQGNPRKVNDHDFKLPGVIKAVPYGIYDVIRNIGFVCVGISADTAEFAVASLTSWWKELGKEQYPNAEKIMITCDCGGSNGVRVRLWKYVLQEFANATGLEIHVCHYPPATSKWNKIEHRLFSFISKNWAGRPLETLDIMLNYIANTVTKNGLKVFSRLDTKQYEKGIKISKKQMEELNIEYVEDWKTRGGTTSSVHKSLRLAQRNHARATWDIYCETVPNSATSV